MIKKTKLGFSKLGQHFFLFDFIKIVSNLKLDFFFYLKNKINKQFHNRKLYKLITFFNFIKVFWNQQDKILAKKRKLSYLAFFTIFQGQFIKKKRKDKLNKKKIEETKDKVKKFVCKKKHK